MDRNSTSILTGTLLVSFLFSSATTTAPGQGTSEASGAARRAKGQAEESKGSSVTAPRKHPEITVISNPDEISANSKKQYHALLTEIIENECDPKRDCKVEPEDFII